jgi:hypothetical protein
MLFRLLSSSLERTWCLSPLHTQHLLNRFIAIPSHFSSDLALAASNVQKLIKLRRSSQPRQLRVPYYLLPYYLFGSEKILTISLPTMDEINDRGQFVSAKGDSKGMIVLSLIGECRLRDHPISEDDGNKERLMDGSDTG